MRPDVKCRSYLLVFPGGWGECEFAAINWDSTEEKGAWAANRGEHSQVEFTGERVFFGPRGIPGERKDALEAHKLGPGELRAAFFGGGRGGVDLGVGRGRRRGRAHCRWRRRRQYRWWTQRGGGVVGAAGGRRRYLRAYWRRLALIN